MCVGDKGKTSDELKACGEISNTNSMKKAWGIWKIFYWSNLAFVLIMSL